MAHTPLTGQPGNAFGGQVDELFWIWLSIAVFGHHLACVWYTSARAIDASDGKILKYYRFTV